METQFKEIKFSDKAFKCIIDLRREVFCGEGGEKPAFCKDERDEKAVHFVCCIGDAVIGCASAVNCGKGVYEIYMLAVKKHYRKFRIGSGIYAQAREYVVRKGAEVIASYCTAESLGFLERMGLAKCGTPEGKHIRCEENLVFEGAEWVQFGGEAQAVIARCDFDADKAPAELLVTGLGFCEIYINGKLISDRLLAPAWTNYLQADTANMAYPIFDIMTNRIFYERIDVSKFMKKGRNTIVFHIGGGWFAQRECPNEGVKPYGDLMLCFKLLQGKQAVVVSGENVKYRKSFVQRSNLYYGEDHDARVGGYDFSDISYDISDWTRADIISKPVALLQEQTCPQDRVIRKLKPTCIYRKGDYAIYDIGENIAGVPVIKFTDKAHKGDTCTMRFAENLNEDGSLNFHSAGGEFRLQKDTFVHDKVCKEYYPRFTWHGARYFDVLGRVEVKEYRVIHTDIKPIVSFKSSNETLQWIFDAYVRTQQNNIHCCVPSDCPHRERLGYTGDGQLTVNAVMTVFDAEALYRKWMQDIADSQDIYTGHVQHTAPFYGGGGGPGGWGGAMVIVPYAFYKHYGDKDVLERYYPNMVKYLDYMEEHSDDGIVMREELGGWCLGDWCSPYNRNLIPEPFVNTYFYLKTLGMTIEVAGILGRSDKVLKLRYNKVKKAFLDKYYDKATSTFCGSLEACDAYGYDLGFGNSKTLKAIVKKYEELGEFDTGIFGTDILIRTLCENGHKELAYKLLTSEKDNTFYNMKKQGATTLWENWNGCDSHSHPMFGAVVEYIVKYFNEA